MADAAVVEYLTALDDFLQRRSGRGTLPMSGHVTTSVFHTYMRIGARRLGLEICADVLTIASIEICEDRRGEGLLRELMRALASEEKRFGHILVECVNEPMLAEALARYGFVEDHLAPNNWFAENGAITLPSPGASLK